MWWLLVLFQHKASTMFTISHLFTKYFCSRSWKLLKNYKLSMGCVVVQPISCFEKYCSCTYLALHLLFSYYMLQIIPQNLKRQRITYCFSSCNFFCLCNCLVKMCWTRPQAVVLTDVFSKLSSTLCTKVANFSPYLCWNYVTFSWIKTPNQLAAVSRRNIIDR